MSIQVGFDSVGGGEHIDVLDAPTSSSATISWAHAFSSSPSAIIVGVSGWQNNIDYSALERSAWLGSTLDAMSIPIPLLGVIDNGHTAGFGWVALYGLASSAVAKLASTTKYVTVQETVESGPGRPYLAGNSVAYSNVIGFNTAVTAFGNSAQVATAVINSKTGDMVVSAASIYFGNSASLASPSASPRYNFTTTSNWCALLIQDTAGSSQIVETCVATHSQRWATIGADMVLGGVAVVGLAGHGALTATAKHGVANLHSNGALTATAVAKEFSFTGPFLGTGAITATFKQIVPFACNLGGHGQLSSVPYTNLVFFQVTGSFFAVADPTVSGVLNSPVIEPINALVTFTPRLPKGELLYVSNYLVTAPYNALQVLTLIGNVTGGTWTASFGIVETPPLAYDITPADLQTALGALATIGAANVFVTVGIAPFSYNVEFTHALGNQWMPPIIGDGTDLLNPEGPGFCEVTTTVTLQGSELVAASTGIALPPLTARIFEGVLSTIDLNDTPGFQLAARSGALGLDTDLIYDVSFSHITFNEAIQTLAPFAFIAPTDSTPVCISDPSLNRLNYQPPANEAVWTPQPVAALVNNPNMGTVKPKDWRTRAAEERLRVPKRRGAAS